MQGMVSRKRSRGKPRQRWEKDIIRLVLWQQQAEWRRTGINFAETSAQRRPDEDVLREEGLRGFANKKIPNTMITMETGGWFQVSLGFSFFGKIVPK